MKLYTEEQVNKIALQVKDNGYWNHLEITPIVLSSDEEIIKERFNSNTFIDNVCLSYRHDFGLLAEEDKQRIRFECKEWMRAIYNNWKNHNEQILNQ